MKREQNMLPVDSDDPKGQLRAPKCRKMPRVVSNQRGKFDNDEIFRKLSRECEVSVKFDFLFQSCRFISWCIGLCSTVSLGSVSVSGEIRYMSNT